MKRDAELKEFDVIVVGSGPGGATVAKELSEKGLKVLIIEWGSNAPIKGTAIQSALIGGVPGRGLLFTNGLLSIVRGITVGGSSVLFYATAFEPPPDVLNSLGVDIRREIEEVKGELPIKPLRDELIGPMAMRIMESARSAGFKWEKLPKFIYQDKCRSDCDRCSTGCPYGAKWTARNFVERAIEKGAVLIDRAKVKRVIVENGKAKGVEYIRNGGLYRAYSSIVVVSAGGIGSPLILRESGIKNAGYNFFFDPLITVMGVVDDVKGGREIPMAAGMHFKEEGFVMTDMTIPSFLYFIFAAQVFRFDRIFSHSRTLQIMIKIKDELGGEITERGGVRKALTKADKDRINLGYEYARRILKEAGAKHIFRSWYFAAHPGGTVKINETVDSNFKTEYENLYVCDCSIIPVEWGLPPTLTILAFGKKLAKYLIRGA